MSEARVGLPKPVTTYVPSSAEVASDYIRTLVFTGVLRTGDKVPVDEIAEVLNISRQPVREALIELSHDGLVETDGRRGTFVADFGPSTIRDHYELYGLLQSFAIRHVAVHHDPAVLDELRRIEAESRATLDVSEATRLAIEFARVINRAARNARLRQVMKAMSRFTPGEYYLANVPEGLTRARASMRAQLHAIEHGDEDEAAAFVLKSTHTTGEALIAHLLDTGVFHDESTNKTTKTTNHRS